MQLFLSERPAQTPPTLVKVGQIQIHENTNSIIFREGGTVVIKSPSPSINRSTGACHDSHLQELEYMEAALHDHGLQHSYVLG